MKQVLFGRPTEFEFRTAGPYRIYEVPGAALVGIPIVMWKRLETFELRSAAHSRPFIKAAFPAQRYPDAATRHAGWPADRATASL